MDVNCARCDRPRPVGHRRLNCESGTFCGASRQRFFGDRRGLPRGPRVVAGASAWTVASGGGCGWDAGKRQVGLDAGAPCALSASTSVARLTEGTAPSTPTILPPPRPLPPLRQAPQPYGAQPPAKRVGFWARDVFRLRSPKIARLESRRDAAVATQGQAAALGGAPVAAFSAAICPPHPAQAGLRVFPSAFFSSASPCCYCRRAGGRRRRGAAAAASAASAAMAAAAAAEAGAGVGPRCPPWMRRKLPCRRPPPPPRRRLNQDKALLAQACQRARGCAACRDAPHQPQRGGPGRAGPPAVTGLRVPASLVLTPHPHLTGAL